MIRDVIGFPGHSMDTVTLVLYKTVKGRIKEARYAGGYYSLYDKERHRQYFVRRPRLLYAVLNGLDLRNIPKDICIRMNGGTPVVAGNRVELIPESKRNTPKGKDAVAELKEHIRLATKLLESYENGDFSDILEELYSKRRILTAYMYARGYARTQERADELFEETLDAIITALQGRTLVMIDVIGYMRHVLRGIISKRAKIKKMLYKDDIYNDY